MGIPYNVLETLSASQSIYFKHAAALIAVFNLLLPVRNTSDGKTRNLQQLNDIIAKIVKINKN